MRSIRHPRCAGAALLVALGSVVPVDAQVLPPGQRVQTPCEVGSYLMADGTSLDIAPGAPGQLRWTRLDGRTGALTPQGNGRWSSTLGWTDRSDGHHVTISDCTRGEIRFDDVAGQRTPLIQIDTSFQGSGVALAGRLTLPVGEARVPIVVLIHGAEHSSALETYALQRQFASAGIGVFAYDKRGTGASGGRYSQNYLLLATDAVLAMREARRLAGVRAGRVGYQGGSQGGWVAPLAAHIEPVDFVIVSFGLAVSPLDEDREAIAFDMERAGFGPEIKAKAMEVADATAMIVASNFTDGYEQLETVKRKYGQEPWFKAVRGNVTAYLLATSTETSRNEGPSLLEGVPAQYDPVPVLANLEVPQLWILGGQDRDAPPGETIRRLAVLRKSGRPITTVVFPGADHGMYEFETLPDGERVSTRQPEGYFALMSDFIKGRAGKAVVSKSFLLPLGNDARSRQITGCQVVDGLIALVRSNVEALGPEMGDPAMDRGEILGFLARAEVLVAQSDKLLKKREQLAEILYRCDLDTTTASELLGGVEQTLSDLLAHRSHLVEELAQLDYAEWLDTVSAYKSEDAALARRAS